MNDIIIRFAEKDDITQIMRFIDEYWKKGHIMSRDRSLFDFQHVWEDEVSFVIAELRETMVGVLGFIPYGNKNRDVALAIWKAIKIEEDPLLGIHILEFLRNNKDIRTISAPGINKKTRSAYEFLGIKTGVMNHWHRLNRRDGYKIAVVNDLMIRDGKRRCPGKRDGQATSYRSYEEMLKGFPLSDCLNRGHKPFKSLEYIKRRYFTHPAYHYTIYGCGKGDKRMLLILRVQPCNGSNALRVIDCIGDHDLLGAFTPLLDRLMDELDCEYVDCYESGMDERVFRDGGWNKTSETANIIPEYFSPYEQKNIDIYYMSEIDGVVLFKGDGDMDRPN